MLKNNLTFLTKGLKTSQMFDKKQFEELATAAGLFAKGFKLLRKVFLQKASAAAEPEPVPEQAPEPEVAPSDGLHALDAALLVPKPQRDRYLEQWGIETLEFSLTPAQMLGLPRSRLWGVERLPYMYGTLLSGRVRADRFKNAWVWDPSCKKSWRKISERQLHGIFVQVSDFYDSMVAILESGISHDEFYLTVGKVSQFRWKRRQDIIDAEVTSKSFLRFVRDEHRRLPSVCARKAPKKN